MPNFKNNSSSMRGIFGGPTQSGGGATNTSMDESASKYKGLLPNLNNYPTKRDGKGPLAALDNVI